jgi:Nif-specific regulatory protein
MPTTTHHAPATPPREERMDWRAQEMLLLSQVMRGVGRSVDSQAVLREMLHLMSEVFSKRGMSLERPDLGDARGVDPL